MSFPVINRWGLNLFWTKYWFNDKLNIKLNHGGSIFEMLFLIYLNYGLTFKANFEYHPYWYFKVLSKQFFRLSIPKYFRFVEHKSRILNESSIIKLRTKIKNIYFSKLWIFGSQKWLIFNIYLYNPIKKKKTNRKKKQINTASTNIYKKFSKINIIRIKTLLLLLFEKKLNNNHFYFF